MDFFLLRGRFVQLSKEVRPFFRLNSIAGKGFFAAGLGVVGNADTVAV